MEELVIYGSPTWGSRRRKVHIPYVGSSLDSVFYSARDLYFLLLTVRSFLRKPGPNEVLIKVVAAGLNPKDWKVTCFFLHLPSFFHEH